MQRVNQTVNICLVVFLAYEATVNVCSSRMILKMNLVFGFVEIFSKNRRAYCSSLVAKG